MDVNDILRTMVEAINAEENANEKMMDLHVDLIKGRKPEIRLDELVHIVIKIFRTLQYAVSCWNVFMIRLQNISRGMKRNIQNIRTRLRWWVAIR